MDGTNRLIGWDVVEELPATGSFSVKRHVVATDYGELTPSPPPEESPSPMLATGASGSQG